MSSDGTPKKKSSLRKPTIPKLSKFSGDQNLEGYIKSFEKWAQYSGIDEDDWPLALLTHLEGEALDFVQNLSDTDDYESMVASLKDNFSQ